MEKTKSDWYFIVNPRAGSGKTMSQWVPAEKHLTALGLSFTTAFTTHRFHAVQLAAEAAEQGYRRFIAVGGDGSVHEVFNGILQWCDLTGTDPCEFYIGVAPIGSGNDWIKSRHIPHDMDKVCELIHSGSFSQMDVVKVTGAGGKVSYMANIGGAGFDSQVCIRVNQQKESGMRGKRIYIKALLHTIFNLNQIDICVKADGRVIHDGPAYSFALGNGSYSGSGMRQVPLASMDDDILDVMVVPKVPVLTISRELPRLFNGRLHESTKVIMGKCKRLEINARGAEVPYELDGEIEGCLPIVIEMEGRHINALKGRD